jgi:hypothetical protein
MIGRDRRTTRTLIVEPDHAVMLTLRRSVGDTPYVTSCHDFLGARTQLLENVPDVLITNIRLAEYNGLHLVLLSRASGQRTRCLVYSGQPDLVLVNEARDLGALFERTERLRYALPRYIDADGGWPQSDRRDPFRVDRRTIFRGGRRASDVAELVGTA